MRSIGGFTIVELVITIVIIGVLSSMVAIAYGNVQRDARDSTRHGNAVAVQQALEHYYAQNGEYPSVRSLSNTYEDNTGVAVAAKLDISKNVLLMPNMPPGATNMLTNGTETHDDYLVYVASSGQNNDSCQTLVTGGCDEFTLKYQEESGDVVSLESRHRGRPVVADASLETPDSPTLTVALNGSTVLATVDAVTCAEGAAEYAFHARTNDSAWSSYSDWSADQTASQPAKQGVKYTYQAKSRCNAGEKYTPEATSIEVSYVHPIATPAAPTLSVTTAGDISTWNWNATSCPAGTTARYEMQYAADWGYDSDWYGPYADTLSDIWDTSDQGYQYTTSIRTHCHNSNATSKWSASASASYIRPITAPGAPTNFVGTLSADHYKYTWDWTQPACADEWVRPEMSYDMYIEGTAETTWYWTDTGQSGWHGWYPRGWFTPSFSITQDPTAPPIPSGATTQMRAKYQCVNPDTGRISDWGPVGTGPMTTINYAGT